MFEQAILATPQGNARRVTFVASLSMQMLFIGTALILPLFFIEGPSIVRLNTMLMAPPAPPPPPRPVELVAVPKSVIGRMFDGTRLMAPVRIPAQVAAIVEDTAPAPGLPVERGIERSGSGYSVFDSLLRDVAQIAPPPPAPKPQVIEKKPDPPPAPARLNVSSGVQSAKLIHKVMPLYPPLARQARISGTVKLMGIISREGRIMQLQVSSGHPLLIGAAVDAVRQWIYKPTLLNNEPVEVVAPIDVNFILGQ